MKNRFLRFASRKAYIITITILLFITFITCYIVVLSKTNAEVQEAFHNFNETQTNAWLTLDPTQLSEVATGEVLEFNTQAIEELRVLNISYPSAEQTKVIPIIGFRVLEYDENRAVAQVIQRTISFSQNPKTGIRTYSTTARWYEERVVMVKEDGKWKVKQIDIIRQLFDM